VGDPLAINICAVVASKVRENDPSAVDDQAGVKSRHMRVIEQIFDDASVTSDYAASTEIKPNGLRRATEQGQVPYVCLDSLPESFAGRGRRVCRGLDGQDGDRRADNAEPDPVAGSDGD
jgi:hypothetical protein